MYVRKCPHSLKFCLFSLSLFIDIRFVTTFKKNTDGASICNVPLHASHDTHFQFSSTLPTYLQSIIIGVSWAARLALSLQLTEDSVSLSYGDHTRRDMQVHVRFCIWNAFSSCPVLDKIGICQQTWLLFPNMKFHKDQFWNVAPLRGLTDRQIGR